MFQNLDFGSGPAIPLEFGAPNREAALKANLQHSKVKRRFSNNLISHFRAHIGAPNSTGTAGSDPKSKF